MKYTNILDRVVAHSLGGSLPLTLMMLAIFAGLLALTYTPREEEPQIVVPMIDVLVDAPGLSARQVERQVTTPLEKLLAQIPGVEHVYSGSHTGQSEVTLRFYVGHDREDALLNTYNKLYSNQNSIPAGVQGWRVRPVEVDDVPILMVALYANEQDSDSTGLSDFELRRMAEELTTFIQSIDNTSEVQVIGGRPRNIRVLLEPEKMVAKKTTVSDIITALNVSNSLKQAGTVILGSQVIELETGDAYRNLHDLKTAVVNVVDGVAVHLADVATLIDGPAEVASYTWIDFSSSHPDFSTQLAGAKENLPMVAISVAKQRGSNAVTVSEEVIKKIEAFQADVLPSSVKVEVLRDYGKTANDKVDNLTNSLLFAVFTVVVFVAVFLGWRPALVVGLAVPISYGITLALDMAFGYTINRVTLFALILSLGLLVDDPITGVDNIERFLKKKSRKGFESASEKIVAAISEVKAPLVMSTITIMLAFIPLAFITGMMGPYMAPMAFNVPVSVIASTLVAFLVTPWLGKKLLRIKSSLGEDKSREDSEDFTNSRLYQAYSAFLSPMLSSSKTSKLVLWSMLGLFILAAMLPVMRVVPLKLLPFDNKNEIQILIDLPVGSSLEATSSVAKSISSELLAFNEVEAVAAFVGIPSAIDFNGMVRRYYQRHGEHLADLRLKLNDKALRDHQSHAIVLRMREALRKYNKNGVFLKVVEVPPGPPVMSTLVAEVYGDETSQYGDLEDAATKIKNRLEREPHVVEVDTSITDSSIKQRFVLDKTKAALSGVSTEDVNVLVSVVGSGKNVGVIQQERDAYPVPVNLEFALEDSSTLNDILGMHVKGQNGVAKRSTRYGIEAEASPLVAIGELGSFHELASDHSIYHKDLNPVVYVTAELNGRTPAEIIADVSSDQVALSKLKQYDAKEISNWENRTFLDFFAGEQVGDYWTVAHSINVEWGGEGEWLITIDVFRDMGIAFLFALIGIFIVLKIQTSSSRLALIIMSAIPLTVIGIMPGFALLNQFGEREIAGAPEPVLFTATAMIGMIALAGIVVRNSLILVEFITQAQKNGADIRDAVIQAGAVRMRPVLLTAGTTMLGNLVIILDPVFSGLALAIIFGIIASTLFTLIVVPIVYLLVFANAEEANNTVN